MMCALQAVATIIVCGLIYCLSRFVWRLYHATVGGRKWCAQPGNLQKNMSIKVCVSCCSARITTLLLACTQVAEESPSLWTLLCVACDTNNQRINVSDP